MKHLLPITVNWAVKVLSVFYITASYGTEAKNLAEVGVW